MIGLNLRRDGVIMKLEFPLMGSGHFGDWTNNWLHKSLSFNHKRSDRLCFCPSRRRLGTDADLWSEPR